MNRLLMLTVVALIPCAGTLWADGPADNVAEKVRPVPPPGIEVPAADEAQLKRDLAALDAATRQLAERPALVRWLPDVQIFDKAVGDALAYREFFAPADIAKAKDLLAQGAQRAEQLRGGTAPWATATGPVVRGYVSRIDGSVQPLGLVVPESYEPGGARRHRLDIWFHGRGETLSEVNFLADRGKNLGEFAPLDTFVLHTYGRYCNAAKFAGEIDALEALAAVQREYRIDEDRIGVRGFSMGGASAWHFAVHYPGRWYAANPGAGFSETPDFLKVFQSETLAPSEFERKLWHLYDCTDYAGNLANCPTVAYSGELDVQKQAADIMAKAMAAEGLELVHIIGPGTKHSYHPDAKATVERLMAEHAARGRTRVPPTIDFTTYTLRYNNLAWVTIDGLGEHWQRARVQAKLSGTNQIEAASQNVTDLTLAMPAGDCPFEVGQSVTIAIDAQRLVGPAPAADRSWSCALHQVGGQWQLGERPPAKDGTRKRHGLQGPIDDAFMDSFLFVRPTGKSPHPAVAAWVQAESERAIREWRRQFRGQPRVKLDSEVSDADIQSANLVLWGDPASNVVLRRIAERLPIRWQGERIGVGEQSFPTDEHALILVCPNPLNPARYVVLNSGFTFREYDYLNNARQVPKLPDWAVIDVRTPPGPRYPGKIVAADFFDEAWQVKQ